MTKTFRSYFREARQRADYWAAGISLDFAVALNKRMKEIGLSKSKLATKINSTPAYVTKVLRGDVNFTIKTMATLAMAVNSKVSISLEEDLPNAQVVTIRQSLRAFAPKPVINVDVENVAQPTVVTCYGQEREASGYH